MVAPCRRVYDIQAQLRPEPYPPVTVEQKGFGRSIVLLTVDMFFDRSCGWIYPEDAVESGQHPQIAIAGSYLHYRMCLRELTEKREIVRRVIAGSIYQPITDSFQDLIEISFLYRAGLGSIISRFPYLPVVTFTAASLLSCFTMRNTQEKTSDLKFTNRTLLTAAGVMFWSIISLSEISEFLYFNF